MPFSHSFRYVFLLGLISSASLSAAMAGEAALVIKVGGKSVTLVRGEKASAPRVQTLLAQGDRLIVGQGSFVDIEYLADSCAVSVKSGDGVTIGATSPCAEAAAGAALQAQTSTDPAIETARVIPAAAGAAEVSRTTGSITRINVGAGLVDAAVGDSLVVGDEVFAGPGSAVTLYFPVQGCSYTVTAGNMYKVSSQAPCKGAGDIGNGSNAAVEGGASGVPPGVVMAAFVAGSVALVALSAADDDGKKNPATPD